MDQILQAVDNAATISRKARDSQQKLFDGHQKVSKFLIRIFKIRAIYFLLLLAQTRRFDTFGGMDSIGSSSRSGDVNPKHLLKTMQNKY